SGSIGTKSALDAAKDGYTWTAGAAVDLGSYKVLGMLDTNLTDWALYYAIANVTVTAENPGAPYKDFGDLLTALKTNGANVAVATAGLSSAGHNMMEMIKAATGVTYKHVTYDGGNPAVIAAVSGETPVVTQLLVEMSEHIKAKRLKPLAALNDKPVMLEGYGEIPPITQWIPNMKPPVNYFGIWVPKNAPADVLKTMDMVWQNKIAKSDALKKYAAARSAIFAPLYGQEAFDGGMKMVRQTVWLYFDAGKAKVSPDTVGIARP
ncbi:MAG: Bug family tripartite tricarboxylate transporter substrate binding protein, partial [Acidobacteriota bacterium]